MKLEYVRHASARMFDNAFLEACSKVHPLTPLAFYGPIVLGLLGWGLWSGATDLVHLVVWAPVGVLIWLALEYTLHRFLFHWEGSGPLSRRFHEIIHGYHHQYPDDGQRLVMPLGASIPLAIVVAGVLWAVRDAASTIPIFCAIVTSYLVYDYTHFAVHFFTPRTAWGKALRAHHMAHHFATPDKNFGISNRWVDRLVGTLKPRRTVDETNGAAEQPPARPVRAARREAQR